MSPVTRRGALSLLPAAVASVATSTAALAAASPDAGLIRLSAEFDAAYARWRVTWRAQGIATDEGLRDFYNQFGSIDANMEAFSKFWEERGLNSREDENSRVCDRLNDLARDILRVEPQGLAGLAAWARAMNWSHVFAGVWEGEHEPRDEDEEALLALLKAIRHAAGEAQS